VVVLVYIPTNSVRSHSFFKDSLAGYKIVGSNAFVSILDNIFQHLLRIPVPLESVCFSLRGAI
jgi:hypothetical protein